MQLTAICYGNSSAITNIFNRWGTLQAPYFPIHFDHTSVVAMFIFTPDCTLFFPLFSKGSSY